MGCGASVPTGELENELKIEKTKNEEAQRQLDHMKELYQRERERNKDLRNQLRLNASSMPNSSEAPREPEVRGPEAEDGAPTPEEIVDAPAEPDAPVDDGAPAAAEEPERADSENPNVAAEGKVPSDAPAEEVVAAAAVPIAAPVDAPVADPPSFGPYGPEHEASAVKIQTSARGKLCLLYTSPSPRDRQKSRMPSSA